MKPPALFTLSVIFLGYAAMATSKNAVTEPKVRTVNFGRDVRPILSQHCFKCHGPDASKAAAGLRLDDFAEATRKLADGCAIVPGSTETSLLLKRVSSTDPDELMPPKDGGGPPLTKDQIGILSDWIRSGAGYEKHWSFVPPRMPKLPNVKLTRWVRNSIDRFVLAKLEEEHLRPEPEADRDTLALRASQTLTGLPPTQEELSAFRQDRHKDAYERFVDHLLAKPEYGEHQARYWLDAVRYGDTHGLQLDNERSVYPYRDWVVRAFNNDLPYNKFIEWQLAGDLLTHPTKDQLIATGYVRMNLTSNEGGAIAEEFLARNTFDRVDTTSTVMLGLTVGCAKCHDHKYDPISQKDYYGLCAYFDSTTDEPLDGNIALPPPYTSAPTPEQNNALSKIESGLVNLKKAIEPSLAAHWLANQSAASPRARDWEISPIYSAPNFDVAFDQAAPGEPGQQVPDWKPFDFQLGRNANNIIRKENSWVYVRGLVHLDVPAKLSVLAASDDAIKLWLNGKLIHSHKINRGLAAGPDTVTAEFKAGDNEIVAKVVNGAGVDGLNLGFGGLNLTLVNQALSAYRAAPSDPRAVDKVREAFLVAGPNSPESERYQLLMKERQEVEKAIPMTLVAQEMAKPRPTFVLKRGLYDQKGDPVDRHIPKALGDLLKNTPNDRLGLAKWMTHPNNPLVARVFVNRLWQQHFGLGLVKTVEDFGSQGEWPLNQPLLDFLAVKFSQVGWSVKRLNRLIVTSATFRQSSRISAEKLMKDPENRLNSRGPRFRLDAEVIRDKALEAGGLLVDQLGGHGIKPYQPSGLWEGSSDPASGTHTYTQDHGSEIYRRSLYLFWKRTSPPPVMITFDAPLRDTCIVRRSATNTPLQALAVLNEPSFLEASRTMATRVYTEGKTDEGRLRQAFEIALARSPSSDETNLLLKAVHRYRKIYQAKPNQAIKLLEVGEAHQNAAIPQPEQATWMLICSSLMNTDEFLTQH